MADEYRVDQVGGLIRVYGRQGVYLKPSPQSYYLVGKVRGSVDDVIVVVASTPRASTPRPKKRISIRQSLKARRLVRSTTEPLTAREASIVKNIFGHRVEKIVGRSRFLPKEDITVFIQDREADLRELDPEEAREIIKGVSLRRVSSRARAFVLSGKLKIEPVDPIPNAPPPPPPRRK